MKSLPDDVLLSLKARYSEPQRHYHTWTHIEALLKHFEEIRYSLNDAHAVLLALYWHDAVYDPTRNDNEELSALLLLQDAKTLGTPEQLTFAATIIHATASHKVPKGLNAENEHDLKLFLDIDLSILATAPDVFRDYERNIRREYHFVPAEVYRQARSAILKGFLERPRLYFSDYFFAAWETKARSNLSRSIAQLSNKEPL